MDRRPTREETEDDLLHLQEEFLRSSSKTSAAKLVRAPGTSGAQRPPADEAPTKKRVKFSEVEERRSADPVQFMDIDGALLSDVVERNIKDRKISAPTLKPNHRPFPEVIRLKSTKEKPARGQSLFAKHLAKGKEWEGTACDVTVPTVEPPKSGASKFGERSRLVDGTGLNDATKLQDVQRIHEENVTILSAMNEAEILKEREKLLKSLDPALVHFLKRKKESDGPPSHAKAMKEEGTERKKDGAPVNDGSSGGENVAFETLMEASESFPIKPSKAQKWLHMDLIEEDKLSWMLDPPKLPEDAKKHGYNARFNFEGELMSPDDEVESREGLHHHGNEPQLAGYTLEELIQYSRSSVSQQNVLALRTMGNVVRKTKLGLYDNCLDCLILPKLLDAGIPLLLRLALDASNEGTREAAIYALHALIVNEPDEVCLDVTFTWASGCQTPFLQTANGVSDKELEEMPDVDVFKLDCIKGLLRTDIVQRLFYILDKVRPPAPVVASILEILIRIARHSLASSHSLFKTTKMIKLIITNFMPLHWVNSGETKAISDAYGIPLPHAVKLIRVLASASRSVATSFVHDFRVMEPLLRYVSIDPTDLPLPSKHLLHLILESMRAWQTFLMYGLSSQQYIELFPLIMKQLHCCPQISMSAIRDERTYDYDYTATLLAALVTVVDVAASHSSYAARMSSFSGVSVDTPPVIEWSHVEGILPPVLFCTQKWLRELQDETNVNHSALKLMGSAFNFLANFYSRYFTQATFQVVNTLDQIEKLFRTSLVPFVRSSMWQTLLRNHRNRSNLLSKQKQGTSRDSPTLPSVGSVAWGGAVVPVLNLEASLHFLEPFANLIVVLVNVHKQMCNEISSLILNNPLVTDYLRNVLDTQGSSVNWFTRYETRYIYHFVKLAKVQVTTKQTSTLRLFYQTALRLLAWLQVGDDHLALDLFSSVIFNPSFWSEEDNLIDRMRLLSVTSEGRISEKDKDRARLLDLLPQLRTIYLQQFEGLHPSSVRNKSYPSEREHISILRKVAPLLPPDWPYLPIKQAWIAACRQPDSEQADTNAILRCLQWICILECWHAEMFEMIPTVDKYCHLGSVFLIASDLFLDAEIRRYLEQLCVHLLATERDAPFNTKKALPTSKSFRDFYLQMLTQFGAVSYGDHLFGLMIFLPLQQHYDVQFRKDAWIEHSSVLQYVTFAPDKFPIRRASYLSPAESDKDVLAAYYNALISGSVRKTRSPLPYMIAVHHLHMFLYAPNSDHSKLKSSMLEQLKKHHEIAKEIEEFHLENHQ